MQETSAKPLAKHLNLPYISITLKRWRNKMSLSKRTLDELKELKTHRQFATDYSREIIERLKASNRSARQRIKARVAADKAKA
jgi:hypothetical protein|tara:strand:+ start:1433 stop:1681 length:249 start_codon:yes stop_codon:yes gene_type:complete